ncbi:MAG: aminodeoxychorismate/anthranilate synthase component II [Flavobacteriaceae bacterium]|nr:aminodeoxychorismate/anthranilate synthase component II [Flavobacteriaceae bacterium]
MKVLLIDHNDSFTYNIIELLRSFKKFDFKVINYSELNSKKIENFDKLIISPGPSLPKNYIATKKIIRTFYKTKPILGICLGHQAISQVFNASLENLSQVRHGMKQEIIISNHHTLFKNINRTITVGLYHSWIVSKINFPKKLEITSLSDDGIIMSLKHKKYPVFGIQFHPESFLTIDGKTILKNFLEL